MNIQRHLLSVVALTLVAGIWLTGCDVGTNPLLFDGTPATANFAVSTSGNSYSDSKTLALNDMLSSIDVNIDSVSVINISLQIDSLSGGTQATTTITGTSTVDSHTFLTLTGVPLSTFSTERSIFDPTLTSAGIAFGTDGVAYINNLLKHPESLPSSVTVAVNGTASQSGLHFKAHLKFYTQIFTAMK